MAIASRCLFLSRESLWLDEGWSWWVASLSPAKRLAAIRADVVAPAYFYLLAGWSRFFGDGVFAMRALSAVFATLTLIPFWILARQTLVLRRSQLVAAALMAVSFMQTQYTREARPYALLCLAIVAALACVPTLADRRSWRAMIAFALCAIVGAYTHNVMPFYMAALAIAWLIWPGERPLKLRLLDLAIMTIVCGLACAPWLPVVLEQKRWMTGQFWATRPDAFLASRAIAAVAGVDVYAVPPVLWRFTGLSVPPGVIAVIVLVLLLGGMGVVVSRGNYRQECLCHRGKGIALAVVAFAPIVLVFAASWIGQPIFIERVFIASSALLPLLIAMACEVPARAWRIVAMSAAAVLIVLGLISTASLFGTRQKEDWRSAYDYVAALPPARGRLIVFVAPEGELPFAYYAAHDTSRTAEPRTGVPGGFLEIDPPRTIRRVRSDEDLAGLRDRLRFGSVREVVLMLSHDDFADPEHRVEAFLRRHGRVIEEREFLRVRVLRVLSAH